MDGKALDVIEPCRLTDIAVCDRPVVREPLHQVGQLVGSQR
jgi:hypothetical protein